MINNPAALYIIVGLTALYFIRILYFNDRHLKEGSNSFLYIALNNKKSTTYVLMTSSMMMIMPVVLYFLYISIYAVQMKKYSIILILFIPAAYLYCLTLQSYRIIFRQNIKTGRHIIEKIISRIIPGNSLIRLYIQSFAGKNVFGLLIIKMLSLLPIVLILNYSLAEGAPVQVINIVFLISTGLHTIPLLQIRGLENNRMLLFKNLPISNIKRMTTYIALFLFFIIPECILLLYYSISFSQLRYSIILDYTGLYLSFMLLQNCYLLLNNLKIESYIYSVILLVIFFLFYIMTKLNIFCTLLPSIVFSVIFFNKKFYKYNNFFIVELDQ